MPAIDLFSQPVREWFTSAMGTPTRTQEMGWPMLASGKDALVCAPTGTGKTLCAFLLSIDRLLAQAEAGQLTEGVRVLYISPLRALGNDIANNLDIPLAGISQIAPIAKMIQKAVRSGDTSTGDRRRMASHPPHILITTPESLYLLLTSQAGQSMFGKLETVIVDEIHAILETKRGTHLSLSLERLKRIRPYQRIGLTATVEPLPEAAAFLGGTDSNVQIIDAREKKAVEVLIECPADDFRTLPQGTIWPEIAHKTYELAKTCRQTLVFCNGRAVAENVATGMNREAGEYFAATHHGSMDKDRRLDSEMRFKSGELRCLCATSSMELGIDVGAIDLVVQIASPKSSARGMQRLGRSGHRPSETSRMSVLPRTPQDALESALVIRSMLQGHVEPMRAPRLCLDVLAQHIVSMACVRTWHVEEIYTLVKGAYPYRELKYSELLSVLKMLRGDFEHKAGRDFRPRIYWDEIDGSVRTDSYGRMLAVTGSTIPDRGLYPVVTQDGIRVGELDEAFVYESRIGDRFRLGAFAWVITRIQNDRVVVAPTDGAARIPFWTGDGLGRPSQTGEEFGRQMAMLETAKNLKHTLHELYPIDEAIASGISRLLKEQMDMLGCLPNDKRLVVEHFKDESGECLVAVHCVLGGRVNQALAMALRDTAGRLTGRDTLAYSSDDGVLVHLTGEEQAPSALLEATDPEGIRAMLLRDLPATPRFTISFRQAAVTALTLGGARRGGARLPLWVQRIRGGEALSRAAEEFNHPLIVEAYRECMERVMEVDRAIQLLRDIRSGEVEVVEVRTNTPSPLTSELRAMILGYFTYYEAEPQDVTARGALASEDTLAPPEELMLRQTTLDGQNTPDALYSQLLRRGTLTRGEFDAESPHADELIKTGRVLWVGPLLVAAHEAQSLARALEGGMDEVTPFLLRYIRAAGEVDAQANGRFMCDVSPALEKLTDDGELAVYYRDGEARYAPLEDAQRALAIAAKERRAKIKTVPGECYAALLPLWQRANGNASSSRIANVLHPLHGLYIEKSLWEGAVLPARCANYKPRDLDQLLMTGEIIWRVKGDKVAFFPAEQPCLPPPEGEDAVYMTLLNGGAQFLRQIAQRSGVTGAELDRKLSELVDSGLVTCDGFKPLRGERTPGGIKRAARARAQALSGEGRWEAAGAIAPLSAEEQLDMLFNRWAIVGKECASLEGLSWPPLLDTLRRMEYRDEVRRGYFVEGLSGMQFVRTHQYERIQRTLSQPEGIFVLSASDPAQAYGRLLPGAGFICVPGTAVVLEKGRPVLAAERRGEQLRLLDDSADLQAAIKALSTAFNEKRLWPDRLRITAKSWPDGAVEILRENGFRPEMLDMTLWRE